MHIYIPTGIMKNDWQGFEKMRFPIHWCDCRKWPNTCWRCFPATLSLCWWRPAALAASWRGSERPSGPRGTAGPWSWTGSPGRRRRCPTCPTSRSRTGGYPEPPAAGSATRARQGIWPISGRMGERDEERGYMSLVIKTTATRTLSRLCIDR